MTTTDLLCQTSDYCFARSRTGSTTSLPRPFRWCRSRRQDLLIAMLRQPWGASLMEQLHNWWQGVHHALQMPASDNCIDAAAYLRSLCDSISRSKLENRNIELVLVEFPFKMSSERCWMMGMIVAELVNNAVRHAFDEQGGAIEVECRTSGAFVECHVSDNGSASSVDVRPGSGLKIIGALAQELGARFQFNFGEDGSHAVLVIPVEQDRCEDRQSLGRTPETAAHPSCWVF